MRGNVLIERLDCSRYPNRALPWPIPIFSARIQAVRTCMHTPLQSKTSASGLPQLLKFLVRLRCLPTASLIYHEGIIQFCMPVVFCLGVT